MVLEHHFNKTIDFFSFPFFPLAYKKLRIIFIFKYAVKQKALDFEFLKEENLCKYLLFYIWNSGVIRWQARIGIPSFWLQPFAFPVPTRNRYFRSGSLQNRNSPTKERVENRDQRCTSCQLIRTAITSQSFRMVSCGPTTNL